VPHVAVLASRADAELVARTAEGDGDEQLEWAAKLAAETAERDTGELLDRFEEERGQRDLAADGTAATFQALARSQVPHP
jgi:hypothetical protein